MVNQGEIEGRLDADFYSFDQLVGHMQLQDLGDLIHFSKETWNQKTIFDDAFPYIEISEVDTATGIIKNVTTVPLKEAPSRAKMIVRNDDILVSTTRPSRGAITYIHNSKNEICIASTGFAVLRELISAKVHRHYLFHILRTSFCLMQMQKFSSGGNYPAITVEALKKIKIPLPPMDVQADIVALMETAYDTKRQKEAEAQALLASIDTYVLEKLGITLPTIEKRQCFGVMSSTVEGSRLDGEYYLPSLESFYHHLDKGKYSSLILDELTSSIFQGVGKNEVNHAGCQLLKVKNILKFNNIDFENVEFIDNFPDNKKLQKNDIIAPFIGEAVKQHKFSVFDREGCYTVDNNVGVIRVDDTINSNYICTVLNSSLVATQLWQLIGGGGVPFLGSNNAKKIKLPLPPKVVQDEIATEVQHRMATAKSLKAEAKQALETAKHQVEALLFGA